MAPVVQVFGTFPATKTKVLGRQATKDWVQHSSSTGLVLFDGRLQVSWTGSAHDNTWIKNAAYQQL